MPVRLSVPAAAARQQVAPITVQRRIRAGILPAVLVDERYEIEVADLDRVFVPRQVVASRESDDPLTPLERAAARVAAEAPPLTDAARERLRELLGGVL
ncbi:hypothetical protein [Microbacterium aurugineum]|uniref:hypothetical protein n=1 Tax=Microbacterium aurugineum TaxID=2851642 RepID=UPI0020BF4DFF|nr:hypothetical protein [Microbacterium aurugineum]MCK8476916.1 hypothetical protein [Microbacterium aurugineum]